MCLILGCCCFLRIRLRLNIFLARKSKKCCALLSGYMRSICLITGDVNSDDLVKVKFTDFSTRKSLFSILYEKAILWVNILSLFTLHPLDFRIHWWSFFFWPWYAACGILAAQPGIELEPLARQSLNHWTAKEVPLMAFPCNNYYCSICQMVMFYFHHFYLMY